MGDPNCKIFRSPLPYKQVRVKAIVKSSNNKQNKKLVKNNTEHLPNTKARSKRHQTYSKRKKKLQIKTKSHSTEICFNNKIYNQENYD